MRSLQPPEITSWGSVLFELRKSPPLLAGLCLGTVGYSLGHAALAFGAGSLAAGLSGAAPTWVGSFRGPVLAPVYLGLAGAIVKGFGSVALAHSERNLASRVAAAVRLRALSGLLETRVPIPAPAALATLVVRIREVEASIRDGNLALVRSVAQLIPLALCLALISPMAAGLAAGLLVPFAVGLSYLRRRARGAASSAQSGAEELETGVDELVRNAELFRTYGATAPVLEGVASASRRAGTAAARVEGHRAALSSLNELLGAGVVILALTFRKEVLALGGGAALPFAAVFFLSYRPLRDLGDAVSFLERGALALSAIFTGGCFANPPLALESLPRTASDERDDAELVPIGDLELDAVGAADRGPRTTLLARPGEIVCLVGPTGSGKTTLIRALLGLELATGRIAFRGRDITGAPVGPAHRPFAWVPQDAPLVTGTVAHNVMLTGSDEKSSRAALSLVAGQSILGIDEGETVGPGGRPLSGGERRLVSLARALSSGLPVLLLDEPTEGLDADSANRVMGALAALRGKRALLIATHRPEVCALADRVVRVGEGEVSRAAE